MADNTLLPLEEYAQKLLSEQKNELPDRHADYWARYAGLLAGLREHVYPHINAGLACLSKSPGIYTDHGKEHFDEVIRYAGFITRLGSNENKLTPYEIYLLLCAIRLHDAGNVEGREEHEKRVSAILHRYGGNIAHDTTEAELISRIAEAHGGKTLDGDKDTIARLQSDGMAVAAITCRPRQVAAIVRFSDEICEHSSRSARHHIAMGSLPDQNKLFHYYANSVTGAAYDQGRFKLKIRLDVEQLLNPYPVPQPGQDSKYLIDDVWDRITKLELERKYCNQFLNPSLQTIGLDIEIDFIKRSTYQQCPVTDVLETIKLSLPSSNGYPSEDTSWKTSLVGFDGQTLARKFMESKSE